MNQYTLEPAKQEEIRENVEKILDNMAQAAKRAGRKREEILLCAACKTRTVEEVRFSASLGIDIFGENHVQELVEKTDEQAYEGKPGHFIGHLQTNKIKKVLGRAALIQSVGSEHLAMAIEKEAAKIDLVQPILLEVNIGREASKGGVVQEDLWALMEEIREKAPHLCLKGLMAIPPSIASAEETRGYFSSMRELLEEAKHRYPSLALTDLSMGMTGDYEMAIEEGATIVRIGTGIYGARDYSKKA